MNTTVMRQKASSLRSSSETVKIGFITLLIIIRK